MCERRGTGTERSENLRQQSGEQESKKWSAAEWSAEWEVTERAPVSEDHRNGNVERQTRSNRVSAEKIASCVFVLIVYSHKVQLDSTTNKQSI